MESEKNKRVEEIEDIEERLLEAITPNRDEFINRRINHINFARTVLWLCIKSRSEDFIYSSELSKFLKVSASRSQQILTDFVNVGILRKKFPTSTLVEYWIEKEEGNLIILDYIKQAKKTLGVDFGLVIKKEV